MNIHHLHHQQSLYKVYGDQFCVVGNKSLAINSLQYKVYKVFSHNTWDIISSKDAYIKFEQELNNLTGMVKNGDILFMYMSDLLLIFPILGFVQLNKIDCRIVLNLFHSGRYFSGKIEAILTRESRLVRRDRSDARNTTKYLW